MFKNINIYCQGWQFETTDEKEANFFSSVSKTAITDRIDLKNFLLKENKLILKRHFETSDTGFNGRQSLYFESSNIDLKLSDKQRGFGLETTVKISDFFRLFDDTTFIKYKVELYVSNTLAWQGIIEQDGIKKTFANDNSNQVLEILCLGWESEFKEYFTNKPLPIWNWSNWNSPMAMYYTAPGGVAGWEVQRAVPFPPLVDIITGYSVVYYQSGIGDWYVSKNAWLHNYPPLEYFNWFVKSGYDRMWSEESVYGFIEKVCNAMGWVWFFAVEYGTYSLHFRERTSVEGLTPYTVSYKDFGRWEVSKNPHNLTYDYVMILDGTFVGGNLGFPEGYSIPEIGADHRGERMIIITDKLGLENYSNHWNSVTGTAGSGSYTLNRSVGYKFIKYAGETDENFKIIEHTKISGGNSTVTHTLSKDKILFVNGGDSGKYYTGCYMDNTSNFLWEEGLDWLPMTHEMLLFKGCYGSMMFQQSGTNLTNYQSYARTDGFKNNFRPFLNSRINRTVTLRVKDLITNPLQYVEVEGYNDEPYRAGNKWSINSMETDLLNNITELQLTAA